jgi:Protein of unknown function (DUF4232)
MRARRRAASGLAVIAVVAIGSIAIGGLVTGKGKGTTPAAPGPTSPAPAPVCSGPSTANDIPAWAASANPPSGVPHLVSPDGNVVAVLFGYPLYTGKSTEHTNKILWIVRRPRNGQPLEITATLARTTDRPLHFSFPADSSPGEIYPSNDNVPSSEAGCWHFALSWNGNHSSMNLAYLLPSQSPGTSATTPATSGSSITTGTAVASGPTTCPTASLTISLSGPIGSAGHFNYELVFRNHSATACTLSGYPGVSFLDSSGSQIGVPASRNRIAQSPVTLAPGATAYAHLSVTDPSVLNGCAATAVHEIRIYPPNDLASANIGAGGIAICASQTPSTAIDPVSARSLG